MAYYYRFDYDVVILFAAADRSAAEQIARQLVERNIKVSLDEFNDPGVESTQPAAQLAEMFKKKARYYMLLISRSFPLNDWRAVQHMPGSSHSIVPVQLDDTDVPGLEDTLDGKDLRLYSRQELIDQVAGTIVREKGHPGPPSRSHDLRSGNVPSTKDRDEP